MELKTALELGIECGLEDVGDAILNIKMRVGQLFEVEDYIELVNNYNESKEKYSIDLETSIDDCMNVLKRGGK